MKVFDIIVGLFYVIGDILSGLFAVIGGFFQTFFSRNKKNNAFKDLLFKQNYIVDLIIFLSVFALIAHYSVIVAFIATFIFYFVFEGYKKEYSSYPDDTNGGAYFASVATSFVLIVSFLIYVNVNIPYQYNEIGTVTLVEQDITKKWMDGKKTTNRYMDIEIDGSIEELEINGCKEGQYKIYKETLEYTWINFLKVDYIAECSNEMNIKKQLDGVKKIKG
jgi:hypothetical protein